MASFTNQIQYYTGDTDLEYSGKTQQWFEDGIRDVIGRVEKTMPDKLSMFTSNQTVNSFGLELVNNRVFSVERGGKEASEVNAKLRYNLTDNESIYYAYPDSPSYYRLANKLYVIPTPGTATPASISTATAHPVDGVNMTKFHTSSNHGLNNLDFVDISAASTALPEIYTKNTLQITFVNSTDFIVQIPFTNIYDGGIFAGGNSSDYADGVWTPTTSPSFSVSTASAEVVTIGTVDNANGEIASFPTSMYHLPVLYTAGNLLYSKLLTIRGRLQTEIETNLDEADKYIKAWGASDNFDFKTMMEDEDTELASLALSGAQTQFANANARMSQLTTDYNWVLGQLQYVKGLYNEGFVQMSQS